MLGVVLLMFGHTLFSQVSISTTSGTQIKVTADPKIMFDGDWINNGTLTPGNSTLQFEGSSNQQLQNTNGALYNLTLDNPGQLLVMNGDILVQGLALLSAGDIDLAGNVLTLDAAASLSETAGNTVIGTTGHLFTNRHLNAPNAENVAGMGVELTTASDMGSTDILRGHAVQSGNGESSIARYFEITPTTNTGLDATLTFYYDESELEGQMETDLKLFRSEDAGTNWSFVESTVDDINNAITATGIDAFSRWTASENCMETIETTTAICKNITIDLDLTGNYTLSPDEVDDNSIGACGIAQKSLDQTTFDCSMLDNPQTVTLTISGNDGNSSQCTATITVEDLSMPIAACQNTTVYLDAMGTASITTTEVDGGTTDNCGFSLQLNQAAFDCADVGNSVMVTLRATDDSGNINDCQATVTVLDDILPVAQCRNTTRALSKSGRYKPKVGHVNDGSSDNCDFTMTVSPSVYFCSDIGDQPVTLTVTDGAGNQSTCVGIVTIIDDFAPKIRCPQNITIDVDPGECFATVDYEVLFADNCDGEVLNQLGGLPSGSGFPVGMTLNTFEVVDAGGLSKQCSFTVTVNDPGGCGPQAPSNGLPIEEQSQSFSELMAYPNPFSGQTNIVYTQDEPGIPKAYIFDLNGRLVFEWQWQYQEAGEYNFTWNRIAHDIPSGVYRLKFILNESQQNLQLILLE